MKGLLKKTCDILGYVFKTIMRDERAKRLADEYRSGSFPSFW